MGFPYTKKFWEPLAITFPPVVTTIGNAVKFDMGDVIKVKVDPPSVDVGITGEPFEVMEKSEDTAVVAPDAPDTAIMQEIIPPALNGEALVHARLEKAVGVPKTTKFRLPVMIVTPAI